MLNWRWDRVLGEIDLEEKLPNGETRKKTKRIYQGNCLGVIGELSTDNESGELDWTVFSEYWNDRSDLKLHLGLKAGLCGFKANRYEGATEVRLNSYWWDKDMQAIADCFRQAHVRVVIEYQIPKKEGDPIE